jgi:hypothetical protein
VSWLKLARGKQAHAACVALYEGDCACLEPIALALTSAAAPSTRLGGKITCAPNNSPFMTSEKPTIALSGVRNSWLIVARKRDFARFAASARCRAWSLCALACSSSAMSSSFSA